jgi:hypothetical protein
LSRRLPRGSATGPRAAQGVRAALVVLLEECEQLWAANQSVNHHDVGLPHGWHLNRARVPVPPPLPAGPKLDAEIRCRIRNLPEVMRHDRKYRNR